MREPGRILTVTDDEFLMLSAFLERFSNTGRLSFEACYEQALYAARVRLRGDD